MLTARPCDALSSFAGPGSSVRSCRLFPRSARFRRIASQRWEKTTAVAVKIKLKRLGKIREPYYRIIVADARTKRDGRAIEEIGKYHPKENPSLIEVDGARVQYWLGVGAQPTEAVAAILRVTGDLQKHQGVPGAEGTLEQPAARVDRKAAFEAAARETADATAAPTTTPTTTPRARKAAKAAPPAADATPDVPSDATPDPAAEAARETASAETT